MIMWVLAAIGISALCILALCRGDPKRLRAVRSATQGHGKARRRLLSVAALLPGLVLALVGDSPAFLVWLGGCAVIGWFLALWFSRRQRTH
jgi:hypothetical protein